MDADKPAPPPYQPSTEEPGFLAVKSLLGRGVKVALVKDSSNSAKGNGVTEYGVLTCVTADIKFAAKKPKVRFSTTYVSAIRDVELQQQTNAAGHSELACRISLQEGAAGSSYSFVCTDCAGQLSSSEVTTFVALVLKDKLDQLKAKKDSGQIYVGPPKPKTVCPPANFEELLEPLGLADKYSAAFTESRIPFENLSVVTREDLAELVGVTGRLDQINIMAQIKRRFPDHWCGCNGDRRNDRAQGVQAGLSAAESAANLFGALAGL